MLITITILATIQTPHKKPEQINNTLNGEWINSGSDLSKIKVAVLYQDITDSVRSTDEMVKALKGVDANFVFGFWKVWFPIPNTPSDISPEMLDYLANDRDITPSQATEVIKENGYYYENLEKSIFTIKKEMPNTIVSGTILVQALARIEQNSETGETLNTNDTWKMALDPGKWNVKYKGSAATKEGFQKIWAEPRGWSNPDENYDFRKARAYFPDITNTDFQKLLLSWAEKQIDSGADAIWIDGLHGQELFLYLMTGDINHIAVKESFEASAKIVNEIHKYGESKGKYVYVGSWSLGFIELGGSFPEIPYPHPKIDFVTVSPVNKYNEVLGKQLNQSRWDDIMSRTRKIYGNIPVFALINWDFDASEMVMFSQKLSAEEQKNLLITYDNSFAKMGVNFVYPVHGGYMGGGKNTTHLAFGKYRNYDSLAPEFNTYETIKELAQNKAKGE